MSPASRHRRALAVVVAALLAAGAAPTGTAFALNPQPEPPGVAAP